MTETLPCDMTAIVLVKNEAKNLPNCLASIAPLVKRIVVVDSGSTDNSVEIARSLGADIYEHEFVHYAAQFNWALDHVGVDTTWVFRIDADEVVPEDLAEELAAACEEHAADDVSAFDMRFKMYFMGRFLLHGGAYPVMKITVFKYGKGHFENRPMGEHIVVSEGRVLGLRHDCLHYDYKDLSSWIAKHNSYATRETDDYFRRLKEQGAGAQLYGTAESARKLRDSFYYRLPMFLRAHLYFIYRYYMQRGFLDGKPGKIYAFLQAYWYRFLVDAKIYEIELEEQKL